MDCPGCGRQIPDDANLCCYCAKTIKGSGWWHYSPKIEVAEIKSVLVDKNPIDRKVRIEVWCGDQIIEQSPVVKWEDTTKECLKILKVLKSQGWVFQETGDRKLGDLLPFHYLKRET